MQRQNTFPRVLCVACSQAVFSAISTTLKGSRFQILSAVTRSQAVALCVANVIATAILDSDSIRGEELSLANALKGIRPTLPIILLEERTRSTKLPDSIYASVPLGATKELLQQIEKLID
jgi:DNA-binding NtrC family response regulator